MSDPAVARLYDNVTVKLVGEDGNACNLIAKTSRAIRDKVGKDQAAAFEQAAFMCDSYDGLLALIQDTVRVV